MILLITVNRFAQFLAGTCDIQDIVLDLKCHSYSRSCFLNQGCLLLKEKMHAADIFCDATGVGMHPLEDLSNIPDPSYFKKDLIVTDTVYAPRETVMMKQAKEAGCEKVYNGMSMMLFQALIAIKLYTGKDTPVDYMKEKLGI